MLNKLVDWMKSLQYHVIYILHLCIVDGMAIQIEIKIIDKFPGYNMI